MQRLEVSGAVRPIYGSLGVKRLRMGTCILHTQLLFPIICTNFINTVRDMGFEGVTCVQALSEDADKSWGSITTELLEQQKYKRHELVKSGALRC